ncbi:MAG: hypothetical protein ACKO66_07140 [Flavobacteriales bacterium]
MMQKTLWSAIFILWAMFTHAQMADGYYEYTDGEVYLNFTVTDGGYTLSEVTFVNAETNDTWSGTGEYMLVNSQAVDPEYAGPWSWYQFSIDGCDYEFSEPEMGELILLLVGCVELSLEEPISTTFYEMGGD